MEEAAQSINTIHILAISSNVPPDWANLPREWTNKEQNEYTEVMWTTSERWLRRDPSASKHVYGEHTSHHSPIYEESYQTGNEIIIVDHEEKTWHRPLWGRDETRSQRAGVFFDALITGDLKKYFTSHGFTSANAKLVGYDTVAGTETTIYEFVSSRQVSKDTPELEQKSTYWKCWVGNTDHRIVRMLWHDEGGSYTFTNFIEYGVDVPPDAFEPTIPEGYTEIMPTKEQRPNPLLPAEIIELKKTYERARKNLPDYRMIVFTENEPKGYVECKQVARQGKKWRWDSFLYRPKTHGILLDIAQDFDDLWACVAVLPTDTRQMTHMTYGGGSAACHWPDNMIEPPEAHFSGWTPFYTYTSTGLIRTLEEVIWPELGFGFRSHPNSNVRLLEPLEELPGCIGIQCTGVSEARGDKRFAAPKTAWLRIHWLDPTRNYMCVRYEQHSRESALWENDPAWRSREPIGEYVRRPGQQQMLYYSSRVSEITQIAQSPEGHWFPTERQVDQYMINERGEREYIGPRVKIERFYIDTQAAPDPTWFEWPEQLPEPKLPPSR